NVKNYTVASDVFSLGCVLQRLFAEDMKDEKRNGDIKLLVESACAMNTPQRASAEDLWRRCSMMVAVRDPHDARHVTDVLYTVTVTDADGRVVHWFKLSKQNW